MIVYVNEHELIRFANRWFCGDKSKAWEALKQKHAGKTMRLTKIVRAA